MWVWDIVPAVASLVFIVGIVLGLKPSLYRDSSAAWIDRIGSPIDPEVRELVQVARGHRLACAAAGALGGLGAGLVASLVIDADPFMRSVIFVGSTLIGVWVGHMLRAFSVAVRPDTGTVRVAQGRLQTTRDFIRPRARFVLRLEVILATAVCVTFAVSPVWVGSGFTIAGSGPMWLAVALIPVSYVLTELLARRLAQRPLPGVTPRSRVWHEALRRETVVDLFTTPAAAVILSALLSSFWLNHSADVIRSWPLSSVASGFYLAACYMPAVVQRLSEPKRQPVVVA